MIISITLTPDDVTMLEQEYAELMAHEEIPLVTVFERQVRQLVIAPIVQRQRQYAQATRIDKLRTAAPEDLLAIDAILARREPNAPR